MTKARSGEQTKNQTMSAYDSFLDEKAMSSNQWSSDQDSLLLLDQESESLLQDSVKSVLGDQLNSHDDQIYDQQPYSAFELDNQIDCKPDTSGLNYYASQYQANPNYFDQSSFVSTTISSYQTSRPNGAGVNYHHQPQLSPGQSFYPYPASSQGFNYGSSYNGLSGCHDSFSFNPTPNSALSSILNSTHQSISMPTYGLGPAPRSLVFDLDTGCVQESQRIPNQSKEPGPPVDRLETNHIKQERQDEFDIQDSLGLANPINANPESIYDRSTDNHPANEPLKIGKDHFDLPKTPAFAAEQCPPADSLHSPQAKPLLEKTSIQMSASSIPKDKKVITLKEAMELKLKKVKVERPNGTKIYYFICSLCTYQTNTIQSMKDHLYCIHCKAKNNYKCNICQQTFGWKNNAQRHMRRKHKIDDQTTKREAIITLV